MMVDPAVKTAMVVCVLLTGFCAAALFRNDKPKPPASEPTAEPLRIRARAQSSPPRNGRPTGQRDLPIGGSDERQVAVVVPTDRRESPPPLVQDTPRSMQPSGEGPDGQGVRVHKIVDGDTLPALARRYLGDAARAREIFDGNRNVLLDPELLPIGAELKIPPRGGGSDSASSAAPARPLVPVPRL